MVTNAHVVGENVREVTVALADKREVPATIVGIDAATDIALLKIAARGLPALPWGDSTRLQVGEWVLAIGSPFQLSQTVTAGIVSATGRANVGFADYEDFIQTDAAINPGNSGGALVNTRGELVGINTGIFSQSGGYQGIGFAVPSNLARHIVDELIKSGRVSRGTILGVRLSGDDATNGRGAERAGHERRARHPDGAVGCLRRRPPPGRYHRRLQRRARGRHLATLPPAGGRTDRVGGRRARAEERARGRAEDSRRLGYRTR